MPPHGRQIDGFRLCSTHPTGFSCEEARYVRIFQHLKTKMAWLLLVVPMMKLMQKRFHTLEQLVRPLADEKVCTIDHHR